MVSPHQMKAMGNIYKWARKKETEHHKKGTGADEESGAGGLSHEHQDPAAEEEDLIHAPEGHHDDNQETEVPGRVKVTVLDRFTVPSTSSKKAPEPDEHTKGAIDDIVNGMTKDQSGSRQQYGKGDTFEGTSLVDREDAEKAKHQPYGKKRR